jgi:hypothetical protein
MVGQENKTPDADTGFVNQYRSTTCCGLLKQPDKHEPTYQAESVAAPELSARPLQSNFRVRTIHSKSLKSR